MRFTRWSGARRRLAMVAVAGIVGSGLALAGAPPAAAAADVSFDAEAGTLAGHSSAAGATVSSAAARHGNAGLAVTGNASPGFVRWNTDVV
ncbi:MAG TPA: hypothetical protein VD926_12725, partial [Acidimicrobiales bacterium]|nr:hypothetical protein [Acidimicrobiales bacterium]